MNIPLTPTIGPFRLNTPCLLAPMAGYTDHIFRVMVRRLGGVGLAFTEMLNPRSILEGRGPKRTALLATTPEDIPLGWQIYGKDPILLCEAAEWLVRNGARLIDLNMGCPQRKIARQGAGAGLLKTPAEAVDLAARLVSVAKVPVTVKIRLGWDADRFVAPDLAKALESVGVAALTVHGRTGAQGFAGTTDLAAIRKTVSAADRMPVIGNGDVSSPAAARRMIEETGCAAIMLGRGVLRHPWLPRDVSRDFRQEPPMPVSRADRVQFALNHFDQMVAQHGGPLAVKLYRKWISLYAKDLFDSRIVMTRVLRMNDAEAVRNSLTATALML